jgi:hypothetical protein
MNPDQSYLSNVVELDFSHLRAEGVGMLLTHPFKERRALDAPIPCSVILAKRRSQRSEMGYSEASRPISLGIYPFDSASTARVPPSTHEEALCEGLRLFAGRLCTPTRRKSQGIHGSVG